MKKYAWIAALALTSSSAFSATYQFDKTASSITWVGGKQFVEDTHKGTIALKEGEVDLQAKGNKGKIVIDMNSIANTDLTDPTYKGKLEGHLKSDDFFKTAEFKDATLVIKDLKQDAKDKTKYEGKGDLTLRGQTHEITFPATIVESAGKIEVAAKLNIDRTKWGVAYASPASFNITDVAKTAEAKIKDKVIKNEFSVDVKLVGKTKA